MFRRKQKPEPSQPEDAYRGLRDLAFDLAGKRAASAGFPSHPDVGGVIVDIERESGYLSLIALGDGTTSMYTSGGGGVLGAGAHAPVAAANERLLAVVQRHLDLFEHVVDTALPPPGLVRVHAVGAGAGWTSDIPEANFWGQPGHALAEVVEAAQQLIFAVGMTTPTED